MNTPENSDSRVKGVDVSHYNGIIDWRKVKDAGFKFAFMKATEGVDYVDETFEANRRGAREAGLAVGYYHFFRPEDSVDAQVTHFVRTVGRLEVDSLRPVLDVEEPRLWEKYTVQERVKMIVEWCQKVKQSLGVTPMIYTGPKFVEEVLENALELAAFDLWVVDYNVTEPTVPTPWTKWAFWQSGEHGTAPGINGDVDLDWFNGSDVSKSRLQEKDDGANDNIGIGSKILWALFVLLWVAGLAAVLAEHFNR